MEEAIEMISELEKHQLRVAELMIDFAKFIGIKEPKVLDRLYTSGLKHDIGKLLITINVLNKPDKLTIDEFNIIKKHSDYGEKILESIGYDPMICHIVKHHHENWDGTGYNGLKGYEIVYEARILRIVDMYDALINKRVYKEALHWKESLEIIEGSSVDPNLFIEFKKYITYQKESENEKKNRNVNINYDGSIIPKIRECRNA